MVAQNANHARSPSTNFQKVNQKMSNPPSYDQHLLDRLNALKNSSIQLDSSK
jgi:hypothetical protein